jgi:hypothetical protein
MKNIMRDIRKEKYHPKQTKKKNWNGFAMVHVDENPLTQQMH